MVKGSFGSKTGSASARALCPVLTRQQDIGMLTAQVRFVPIVLKKSFFADD